MSELKTKKTNASVEAFLDSVKDERQRADAKAICRLFSQATGEQPKMWGPAIIGFGDRRYQYASGREGDWFLAGFSPRSGKISLYLNPHTPRDPAIAKKLAKIDLRRTCINLKRLADVDAEALEAYVRGSVVALKNSDTSNAKASTSPKPPAKKTTVKKALPNKATAKIAVTKKTATKKAATKKAVKRKR